MRKRRGAKAWRVGCAGWALPSAVSSSFPGEGTHLARYAKVFSCVEINSSFYRSHQEKTYQRWAESVPRDFRFSVKMPRTITHDRALRRCDELLAAFLGEVAALDTKLGCVLVQLPPSFALDSKSARSFFSMLRKMTSVPVACEPRHASWFTKRAADVLREANVAQVWAHPSPMEGWEPAVESELLYLRLHGAPRIYYSAYDERFMEKIAMRMHGARDAGADPWCIFDNTAHGAAIPNALTLVDLCLHDFRTYVKD